MSREATRQARQVAESVRARAHTLDPVRVERSEAAIAKGRTTVVRSFEAKRADPAGQWGDSEVGASVRRWVRTAGRYAGQLPVLSLVSDVLDERHGLSVLAERVRAESSSPMVHVQLGEALLAHKHDSATYLALRTALSPTALVTHQVLRVAAGQHDAGPGAAELSMRNAFALALGRLRTQPRDAVALHAMTRVYLAARMAETAVVPGRLAAQAAAAPDRGEVLFTLARAYYESGRYASARRAAEMAIDRGCSLGWRVLAELVSHEGEGKTSRQRVETYSDLFDRAAPEDLAAYRGLSPGGKSIWRSVYRRQADKARNSVSSARDLAERRSLTRTDPS
jgi:hypothetical protein